MLCDPGSKAGRRYLYRLIPMSVVYVAVVYLSKWSFRHFHPTGLVVYLLAILPALPMVGSLAIVGLYVAEETDEFERSILVRSILWGLAAALAISSIWGTLEDFAQAPHLSSFLSYLSFWIVMAISGVIIRLRYR
ncbi:MAG TPA: hypothetical protein VNU92_03460 [Edaphobacter sp.]|nr:hypothetical protein [Edaphobacter sp.]